MLVSRQWAPHNWVEAYSTPVQGDSISVLEKVFGNQWGKA
jgi:hypothetical protein